MTEGDAASEPPIGWQVKRAWGRGMLEWHVFAVCVVALIASVAALGVTFQRLRARHDADVLQLQQALSQANAQQARGVAATPSSNFAADLPSPVMESQVIQELHRAASTAAVTLVTVQAQQHPATIEQLGRLELVLSLRGPYIGTKQLLKQVVERFPSATVQRLRMHKSPTPADVETNVTLSVWSAAVAAR